jgi:hypothetical protein
MRSGARVLPAVWLLAAVPVGFLGYLAFALSEARPERRVGLILFALAVLAILTSGLLWTRPRTAVVRWSLLVSLLWLAGAAYATVTMRFATDRLLLGGLPAVVAVITALLALKRLRDPSRGAARR